MKHIKYSGYTLIELLVALAIFGILILPISNLIHSIIKTNDISSKNLDIANVMNYAYESYLKDPNNLPSEYLGYTIEYETKKDDRFYNVKGIKYDDFDLKIEEKNRYLHISLKDSVSESYVYAYQIPINFQNIRIKTYLEKDELNKDNLIYKIYIDGRFENTLPPVIEPKYLIFLDISSNVDIIFEGTYSNEDNVLDRNIVVKCSNESLNSAKIVTIYPTFVFEKDNSINDSKQKVEKLIINIKKNGKTLKTESFDISNRIKGE